MSYFTLRWDTSARVVAVKATAAILCGKSRSLGFIFTYAAHTQFVQFRPNTQTGHANVEETVNGTKLLTKVIAGYPCALTAVEKRDWHRYPPLQYRSLTEREERYVLHRQ